MRRGRRLTIPRERPGRDHPSIHASYPTRERPGRDHEPRTPSAEHAPAPLALEISTANRFLARSLTVTGV